MRRIKFFAAAAAVASLASASLAEGVSINIFAIPSAELIGAVATTSDGLKEDGIETFYEQGRPVHITLYLTDYPAGAEKQVLQIAEQVAANTKSFDAVADGLTVTAGNWVFVDVDRSPALQHLADVMTVAAEPLRDTSAEVPGWVRNYPNKLEAFERYGSPNVFQNFQPHFTLLASEKSPKLAGFAEEMQANPPHADGRFVGIGVGLADGLGQITKVLGECRFAE